MTIKKIFRKEENKMVLKNYEKAMAEVIVFDNSDVITTSSVTFCSINFDRPGDNTCREVSAAAQG